METGLLKIVENKNDSLSLSLQGDLDIENIPDILNELRLLVDSKKEIKVSIENTGNVDLVFMQLLVAIKKTSIAQGTDLKIHINLPSETKELLNNAGFEKLVDFLD